MVVVRDFLKIVKPTNTISKEYVLEKNTITYFSNKKFTTTKKLEIIDIDLSCTTSTKGFYGESYFMIIVDDFSRMM